MTIIESSLDFQIYVFSLVSFCTAEYDRTTSTFDILIYEVIEDRSLDRAKNSDDSDYVRWAIANQDIKGTSCTIVLCGAETYQRKYVDWEIKATLDDRHGLIGVRLPTAQSNTQGHIIVPDRLASNIHSGFALWVNWIDLTVQNLKEWIAIARDKPANHIVNPATIKQRNG